MHFWLKVSVRTESMERTVSGALRRKRHVTEDFVWGHPATQKGRSENLRAPPWFSASMEETIGEEFNGMKETLRTGSSVNKNRNRRKLM